MAASNGHRPPSAHLRNGDYTDRELLHVVDSCTAGTGYASTAEIVESLNLAGEGPGHAVATRMTWMVRYGFCERNPEAAGEYRLTKTGRNLKGGDLSPEVAKALKQMSHGDRVLVMREISRRSMVNGSVASGHMIRREFTHQYEQLRHKRS